VAYVLIAKRDPLKMDAVFAMPARQFMNYVRLAKDLLNNSTHLQGCSGIYS
jgi:hypothetical protein